MLKGSFELIGDKSISHRAIMFSSISKGNNKRYIDDKKSIMRLVNILRNSAIQNGENVYAYIPSSRMRDLLNKYLNDEL